MPPKMAEWAATSIFTSPKAATEAGKNCQNLQFGVLKAGQTFTASNDVAD